MSSIKNEFQSYIDRMNEIRKLSVPDCTMLQDSKAYSQLLKENFLKIKELAAENTALIEHVLHPLLEKKTFLTEEEVQILLEFAENLEDASNNESVDASALYMIADRLLEDSLAKDDIDYQIRMLDLHIIALFSMKNLLREYDRRGEEYRKYREAGQRDIARIMQFLEKEQFAKITDPESKELVLINSRYFSAIYQKEDLPEVQSLEIISLLERSLSLSEDPFYREQAPDYDWNYHNIRAMEYITVEPEGTGKNEIYKQVYQKTYEYSLKLDELWKQNPEENEEILPYYMVQIQLIVNGYDAGCVSLQEYKEGLLRLYREFAGKSDHGEAITMNFLVPLSYWQEMDLKHLKQQELAIFERMTNTILDTARELARENQLVFGINYISDLLKLYQEIPGTGLRFRDLILKCMVVFHPITYVHSHMVARLTRCLCWHLLKRRPELFLGFEGMSSVEEVQNRRQEIIIYAHEAALLHDIGKLTIIDTITNYGRKLTPDEFGQIRKHVATGMKLAENNYSIRKYANVIGGHHRYFDDSQGYPADFQIKDLHDKVIISLVTFADGMDAATDGIGRSYRQGKSLEEYLEEVRAESGTRYAPYLYEIMQETEVREDVAFLLEHVRDDIYEDVFIQLQEIQDREGLK